MIKTFVVACVLAASALSFASVTGAQAYDGMHRKPMMHHDRMRHDRMSHREMMRHRMMERRMHR